MLAKFRMWYLTYQNEISWFVIGVLFNNLMIHLSTGQIGLAAVDLILMGINYAFWRNSRV